MPSAVMPTASVSCSRRVEGVSPIGLAALAAALHVVVLAGCVSGRRCMASRPAMHLIWRTPSPSACSPRRIDDATPSRPVRSYSAGRLSLSAGMAVIALAAWLQIMRLNGTHA